MNISLWNFNIFRNLFPWKSKKSLSLIEGDTSIASDATTVEESSNAWRLFSKSDSIGSHSSEVGFLKTFLL